MVAAILVLFTLTPAAAQQTWDFSPYEIRAWLTLEPPGYFSDQQRARIEQALRDLATPVAGPAWAISVEAPPEHLRTSIAGNLQQLTFDALAARDLVLIINKQRNEQWNVRGLTELANKNVRLGVADPEHSQRGRRTRELLGAEMLQQLGDNVVVIPAASSQLVQQVAEGELDAAVVYRRDVQDHLERVADITPAAWAESDGYVSQDKLLLVSVRADELGYSIEARELDCHARVWGSHVQRRERHPDFLPTSCARTMTEAFSPLGRIELGRARSAEVRVRAGGLIRSEDNIAHIAVGDVLRPTYRRDDRYGKPQVVEVVPWTYLQVTSQQGQHLQCEVHSGMRGGVSGRRTARSQRLALAVRPTGDSTTLYLRSRDEPRRPMIGYEIWARDGSQQPMQLLGHSDWRGALSIAQTDQPLRLLYVKNGDEVLARLPTIPGLEPALTAQLLDDQQRLEAEAFVKGLQSRMMDLVAVRQVLAVRIQNSIAEGNFEQAQRYLQQLRGLPTREDLSHLLEQRRGRIRGSNPITQRKIDRLFADTRTLMAHYIDGQLVTDLSRQLNQAQQGG